MGRVRRQGGHPRSAERHGAERRQGAFDRDAGRCGHAAPPRSCESRLACNSLPSEFGRDPRSCRRRAHRQRPGPSCSPARAPCLGERLSASLSATLALRRGSTRFSGCASIPGHSRRWPGMSADSCSGGHCERHRPSCASPRCPSAATCKGRYSRHRTFHATVARQSSDASSDQVRSPARGSARMKERKNSCKQTTFLQTMERCPRHESNMRTRFRKPLLYPLSYGGVLRLSQRSDGPRADGVSLTLP
jgi:hypothetical protein